MNDGGDCRTAPATPGLLNIVGTPDVKGEHKQGAIFIQTIYCPYTHSVKSVHKNIRSVNTK